MTAAAPSTNRLQAAIDADKAALCDALGMHRDGGRYLCPACQNDGMPHADGDFSIERGFKCHRCGWSGDGLKLIELVRSCTRDEANNFARSVYHVPEATARTRQTTRKAAKGKKTHRTIDDAVRAAAWGAGRKKGHKWTPTRRDVYRDAEGNAVAAEVRMDRADGAVDDLGKPIKTFSTMHAVKNGWRLGDPPGKWPPHNLPAVLASEDTVVIPEGPKSVEAAASIGLAATTSAYGKNNPKKTDWTPLHGRDVVILPDNDPDGGGMQYAEAVAALVHAAGARSIKIVELPDLPPKGDLYDFIEARNGQTPEAIRAEVERFAADAEPWTPPPDRRAITSPENGRSGGRPPAPLHADTAEAFCRDELTHDGKLTVRHWHGQWYSYNSHGWREVPDGEMRDRVTTYLRNDPELREHAKDHYMRSVMLNLRAHDLCGLREHVKRPSWLESAEDGKNWIAFSNGVVVNVWRYAEALAAGVEPSDYTRPVSADFFSSDFVPYAWEPDAFPERFHTYMDRVQPDAENVHAIMRMLGLLVADTTRYEAFFQLYGSGANGKTVLLDVVKALVGAANVSYVPLHALIERFQPWPLAQAKVNVCGELPTDIGRGQFHHIEGAFKDCVSGGDIEVEKKGADKYTAPCRARFIMATNSLPTFFDKSDGIWRRLRIIPFPEQITDAEKDVELAEKIIATDMPGVMAWALDGLADVIRRGDVSDCPAGAAIKAKHRLTCDHEKQFLTEYYEIGTHADRIKGAVLYEAYRDWMIANGYKPCGAAKFHARVEDVFAGCQYKMLRFTDGATKGFEGIREKAEGDDELL